MSGMVGLGPHAGFILSAYGAAVVVLAGLIAWIRLDARRQARLLAELESQGLRRRSARSESTKNRRKDRRK